MIAALLLGGGVDAHFESSIPKQFVLVDDLPLFIYTLKVFQGHPEINEIYFVCLNGWQAMVKSYCLQFNIGKMRTIINGGVTGQDSACYGVRAMQKTCCADDIVVIHDAIRPLVTEELISDSIRACKECGMGVASITSMDAFMKTKDCKTGYEAIDRSKLVRIQTPQTYRFGKLQRFFEEAARQGIRNNMDVCTMISSLGYKINLSMGSEYNLKINRVEDIGLFKTLKARRCSGIDIT